MISNSFHNNLKQTCDEKTTIQFLKYSLVFKLVTAQQT
jgi:hypothetical protein